MLNRIYIKLLIRWVVILLTLIGVSGCGSGSSNGAPPTSASSLSLSSYATSSAAPEVFTVRNNFEATTFDNQIWIVGGKNGEEKLNDVWSSYDGISWTKKTTSTEFTSRSGHAFVGFNNKLWVIGGYEYYGNNGILKNDVWSSIDGISWKQEIEHAPFAARYEHRVIVHKNKLFLIGGADGYGPLLNDIWSSDDGVNWKLETASASFPPRWLHHLIMLGDRLYLVGGQGNEISRLGDVWVSQDGISWAEKTVIDSSMFNNGFGYQVVSFDNSLWLIGAENFSAYSNTIYSSYDGGDWYLQNKHAQFPARTGYQVINFNNSLFLLGGYYNGEYLNDVWRSIDGVNWHLVN